MHRFHPKGRRLPALERNILKYRAFEMMILLFHIEDLKSFVLDCLRRVDQEALREGTKGRYKRVWALLVSEDILSEEESDDLQALIDYRNQIAHRLHELTFDVSREPIADEYLEWKGVQYNHGALKKLRSYRAKIEEGVRRRFVVMLSFDRLLFEAAEKTYRQELKKLGRVISKQMSRRKKEIELTNAEISSLDANSLEALQPYHPGNALPNGRLSAKGIACCYALFERGMSDLAVSHLMRIAYPSISARRRWWMADRKPADARAPRRRRMTAGQTSGSPKRRIL